MERKFCSDDLDLETHKCLNPGKQNAKRSGSRFNEEQNF